MENQHRQKKFKVGWGRLCILSVSLGGLLSCARPDRELSKLVLQIPPDLKLLKTSDSPTLRSSSAGALECFAVSIKGPGIGTNSRRCGPQTGILGGFAASGGSITLDVPSGSDRSISVFMYLAPAGTQTCPPWDSGFESEDGANFTKTYKLREVHGLKFTRMEETVTLDVGPPASLDDHILAQMGQMNLCQPKISGYLTSTGQILNASGVVLSEVSHPIHSSISILNMGDYSLASFLALSTSHVLFHPDGELVFPPYLRSMVRHPDRANSVIGITENGGIEEVSLSTGLSTPLPSENCGLSACRVPPWMNSITVGPDRQLYGTDHSGNFYRLSGSVVSDSGLLDSSSLANSPEVTEVKVPPYVVQVIF